MVLSDDLMCFAQDGTPANSSRAPVWADEDDEKVEVNIAGRDRLRKLRQAEDDASISGFLTCCTLQELLLKTPHVPNQFLGRQADRFRVWRASSLADKTRAWVKVVDVARYSCRPEVLGGAAGAAQQAGRLTVLQMGHSAQPG